MSLKHPDARYTIDQRVMHAHQQRAAAALEAVDHVDIPQRLAAVHHRGEDVARQILELLLAAGGTQPCVKNMQKPADTAGQHIHVVLQAALTALSAGPDAEQQAELISITATAAEVMRRDPAATLQTWITLHNAGLPLRSVRRGPWRIPRRIPIRRRGEQRARSSSGRQQRSPPARYGISVPR